MKYIFKIGLSLLAMLLNGVVQTSIVTTLTNDLALLQMQNVNYVPQLTKANSLFSVVSIIFTVVILYVIWLKEIKKITTKIKKEN